MTFRPTIIERAYQLAASGDCRTVSDVKMALQGEGYSAIRENLHGLTITRALRKLCDENFLPSEDRLSSSVSRQ